MKLNISFPKTGCQALIEINVPRKLQLLYDKHIGSQVTGEVIGDEFKDYLLKITGGNDKQGFPMKAGVLTTGRVRLLLSEGSSCYKARRDGQRRRKSVRGCMVDANISALALTIIKQGKESIPGLTDKVIPQRLGPKRASKIRKLFNLSRKDDVRQYVIKRPCGSEGKPRFKSPKIQRLITPEALQRQRHRLALKKKRALKRKLEAAIYKRMLLKFQKERRDKAYARKLRRSSNRSSGDISNYVPFFVKHFSCS